MHLGRSNPSTKQSAKHVHGFIGVVILTVSMLIFLNMDFFKNNLPFTDSGQSGWQTTNTQKEIPVLPPNALSIPSLGIVAPLIYIAETNEEAFQKALADGVVHYPATAQPGERGNAYYFGHSSDLPWAKGDYKQVFAKLPDIRIGDSIYVSNSEGKTFHYKTIGTNIVKPSDTSVLSQFGYSKSMLSLQTSYPIGTARERFILQAELVE